MKAPAEEGAWKAVWFIDDLEGGNDALRVEVEVW